MVRPSVVQTIIKQAELEQNWQNIEEDWTLENISDDLSMGLISTNQNYEHQVEELHDLHTEIYEQRMLGRSGEKYSAAGDPAPSYKQFENMITHMLEENPDRTYQKERVNNLRDFILCGYQTQITDGQVSMENMYGSTVIEYEGPTTPENLKNYKAQE